MSRFAKSPIVWQMAMTWVALVAVSVAGRQFRPTYGVTPLAGAAIVAGAVFPNPLVAATVPVTALAVSNVFQPGYGTSIGSIVTAAVVYAALAWPVLLGSLASRRRGMLVMAALASSLVFYLTTNFAVWCFSDVYERTPAGLLACYVAALPFYRWMPVGDVVWTLVLAEAAARCGVLRGGIVPAAPVSSGSAAAA